MQVGEHVRAARKRAGLSQEALARRADMSLSAITTIELGTRADPHYSSLSKIAGALGLSVGELVGETTPLASAPSASPSPDAGAGQRGRINDPVSAAHAMEELQDMVAGMAASWNRDAELYERDGRSLRPYRTLEMGLAVNELYDQFWNALGVLQRHAQASGADPNPATWDPESKQTLIKTGTSIRALAELQAVIARGAASPDVDGDDFRAMREEFDVGGALPLGEDPHWPEAAKRARAVVGLA
jgi:transcriptional regulator with XRE-family HTH domain